MTSKITTIDERTIGGEKVQAVVEKVGSSTFIASLLSADGEFLGELEITATMGDAVRWARTAMRDLEAWVA